MVILLVGSPEPIWSQHEYAVWFDEGEMTTHSMRATRIAADHLDTARRTTLAAGTDRTIEARLISNDG